MKHTRQKELIYHTVLQSHAHPTADEVYNALKPSNPGLSLATVYRNLNAFADEGRILRIPMPSGGDRYDGTLRQHYHMVCEKCGELYDIDLDTLDSLSEQIYRKSGFAVSGIQLLIHGVCESCAASVPISASADVS